MILMSVFGVVSRIAYAAWPNCDSSPRVLMALSMRGECGSLAWEVDPWDACCLSVKILRVCQEITMWMFFSSSSVRVSRVPSPDVLLSQVSEADNL